MVTRNTTVILVIAMATMCACSSTGYRSDRYYQNSYAVPSTYDSSNRRPDAERATRTPDKVEGGGGPAVQGPTGS
jgi:hypothetical protein